MNEGEIGFVSLPTFPLIIKISSQGRALLPANLYPSQTSYINKSTSYLSLYLLLNSFCAKT